MEGLSQYSTQVATVLILFDVVLAMLLSMGNKYETKKLIVASSITKKQCLSWPTGREVRATFSCQVVGYISTPSPTVQSTPAKRTVPVKSSWKINVSYLRAADEG